MSLFRLTGIPLAAMLSVALLCATPSVPECTPGTLAQYEALANGCILGTGPSFTFSNFTFGIPGVLPGAGPSASLSQIAAKNIQVTPIFSPDRQLSLSFSSPAFSVGSGQSLEFLIGYTEDPPPPEIIRVDSQMNTDPPVFPGIAEITTNLCVYAPFTGLAGATCKGTPFSLTVFDNGISSRLFDQTPDFSPPAVVLGVEDLISLNGGSTGSASFTSFENGTSIVGIPEPATVFLCASALALLFMARRVSAKRS
jgi:hypothetical protein